jgi:hypothetical protein
MINFTVVFSFHKKKEAIELNPHRRKDMRNLLPLLAGAAMLAMVSVSGCAQQAGTSETMYKRVPAKEHQRQFPDGHKDKGGCYYDEKADVYFCSK